MIIFLIFYLFLQFAIGYYASKKIKNEADYLIGGRHIPSWLLMFSLFATWFGAETCIGTSGEVYKLGLAGGRADPFGYTLCLLLMGLLIAPKIWNSKYTTLADFYRDRFGERVERLAIMILFLSSMMWGAAQIRAFGQVIAGTTDLPVKPMMFVSFLVVVSYSLMGGLVGDILTDFVQGIILIIGLLGILISITYIDGIQVFTIPTERLTLLLSDESLFERFDRWAIPILGSLVAQESIARILASKGKVQAANASYSAGILYVFVGLMPVLLGLIGPTILPGVQDSEHFMIEASQKYLHGAFQMIFVAALISAILSTIDSILLAGGGLISHNLIIPILKIESTKTKLLLSRLSVLFMALIALIIALYSESIYGLVETASAFGTSGILVITLLGLWSKVGDEITGFVVLVTGVISYPIAEFLLEIPAPFLFSVATSTVMYFLIPLLKFIFSTKKAVIGSE